VGARERHGAYAGETTGLAATGPVMLATLSSRIEADAERLAIESAVENGVPLLVVNVMPMPACPRALVLGGPSALTFPHEEDLEAVRATANRAASWGLKVEHLRVTSPRPAKALVQIANERGAGLLVLGPKRKGIFRFWRAAREVIRNANCLVWVADDGTPLHRPSRRRAMRRRSTRARRRA
jgi:nucleotide-binding universal stress UspA family protein